MNARVFVQAEGSLATAPYNAGVRDGNLVFVAGQIGLDEAGQVVAGGVVPEAAACLEAVETVLAACNASLRDVVKTTVFLIDWDDYGDFNDVYRRYFESGLPARSTVQVAGLARGARIEIEAIAVIEPAAPNSRAVS